MAPAFFIQDTGRVRVPEGLGQEVESRTKGLGYDVVQLNWAGSKARPILRLRIERQALDRPVSVDDCAKVSRALERWLEEDGRLPERYVLEVSSPGVERPLVRTRDFKRFRGSRVVVTAKRSINDQGKRVEGELLGLDDVDGEGTVRLRLNGGDEVCISRDEIEGARLVYEWKK